MIVNFLIKITLSVPFLFPLSSLHSLLYPLPLLFSSPFLSLSLSHLFVSIVPRKTLMDSKRAISTTDTTTSFSSLHTSTGTSNSRGKGSRQQLSRSKEDSDEQQRRRDNSEKKRKDTKSVSGGSSGSSSKQKEYRKGNLYQEINNHSISIAS